MADDVLQLWHRIEIREHQRSVGVAYSGSILWSRTDILVLFPLGSLLFLFSCLIFKSLGLPCSLRLRFFSLLLLGLSSLQELILLLQLLLSILPFFLLFSFLFPFPFLFVLSSIPFFLSLLGLPFSLLSLGPLLFVFGFLPGPLLLLHFIQLSLSLKKLLLLQGLLGFEDPFLFKHPDVKFSFPSPLLIQALYS